VVDAASGNQLWRLDFALVEMFAVQDQIAEQVVGAIEPALLKTESDHSPFRRDGRNITGWDLVRRGAFCFHQVTREGHLRARDLFREACATDPDLPDGYFWLARACAGLIAYGWSDDIDADLKEGMAAAVRAVHLEEQNPYSHYGLAGIYIFAGDFAQAIRAAERAIELSPSFALGYFVLGLAYLCSGQPASAIEIAAPRLPAEPVRSAELRLVQPTRPRPLRRGAEEALLCTVKAAQIRPTWLAATYQKDGLLPPGARACGRSARLPAKAGKPGKALGDNLAPFKRHQPQWIEEMKNLCAMRA
jgi:tetratricopeptide (TPR) repeat protein